MAIGGIDSSQIAAMVEQLKAAAARTQGGIKPAEAEAPTGRVDFGSVLKNSLDQVNAGQQSAEQLGQRFSMGDDSVSLSDVMINMQKAHISFQATVQARNKLVAAYHDIMNMQI